MRSRWMNLCTSVDLDGSNQWECLAGAYSSSGRFYHDFTHIECCLASFDETKALAEDPVGVEFAIWFHDFHYDTKSRDNERRSALAALEFLGPTALGAKVADLIRATDHQAPPCSRDAMLLCDVDLSILGSRPEAFDRYAEAIRREYSWVSEPDYAIGRSAILRSFLMRESIYSHPWFRERFEKKARRNLLGELSRYSATMGGHDDGKPAAG